MTEKNSAFRLAGQLQQDLFAGSPYKTGRRFLHAQWVWALGHIGLLHQLIRWFKLYEPQTQLILVADGAANVHFVNAMAPYLTFVKELPDDLKHEAMFNAVYFGCPDGLNTLVNFYKMIEKDCSEIHLLALTTEQANQAAQYVDALGVKGKFVALQARGSPNDPSRNVNLEEIEKALESYLARGYEVISTGLDPHPINDIYPSVLTLPNPHLASFLLSAYCDQFIGSNSGAWTIAHAYQRPVEIMNDFERSAWIYP